MNNKYASLTPDVLAILKDKATELPQLVREVALSQQGIYLCRGCGCVLFRGSHRFVSTCGWPSFDDEIPQAIARQADKDGRRVEIVCANCQGHLGHVFYGEGLTAKNLRHCVNASAIEWVGDAEVENTEEAIFAAGCFWGVEYYFLKCTGVLKTEVGYIGGRGVYPTYQQVCCGDTGHVEAVRIVFDPQKITYQELVKYFFEIHDPAQKNGQGPDIGLQYLSRIFYFNNHQQHEAEQIKKRLMQLGYAVQTAINPVSVFWLAEEHHQKYYAKKQETPYCHQHQKKFI